MNEIMSMFDIKNLSYTTYTKVIDNLDKIIKKESDISIKKYILAEKLNAAR